MKVSAKTVRRLRDERGWTQERLAAVAQVDLRTVQRIEAGQGVQSETAMAIASAFDVDVKDLQAGESSSGGVQLLQQITSGSAMGSLVGSAEAHLFEHDHPQTQEEADAIGSVLQNLHDWGDIWSGFEPKDRVDAALSLQKELDVVQGAGFALFAGLKRCNYHVSAAAEHHVVPLTVLLAAVVRDDNPKVFGQPGSGRFLPVKVRSDQSNGFR